MKKMVEKRSRWISLGHGEYTEIFSEKDFFLHHAIQGALSRIGGAEELAVDVESARLDSVPKVAARLRSVFGVE